MIFQGTYSYCLTNDEGQPVESHSVAAGLDYPGVSPQHAFLKDSKRAQYFAVTDKEAIEAFHLPFNSKASSLLLNRVMQ